MFRDGKISFSQFLVSVFCRGAHYVASVGATQDEVVQFLHDAVSHLGRLSQPEQRAHVTAEVDGGNSALHAFGLAFIEHPVLRMEFVRLIAVMDGCLAPKQKAEMLIKKFQYYDGATERSLNIYEACMLNVDGPEIPSALLRMIGTADFSGTDFGSVDYFLKNCYGEIGRSTSKFEGEFASLKRLDRAREGAIFLAKYVFGDDGSADLFSGDPAVGNVCAFASGLALFDVNYLAAAICKKFGTGVATIFNVVIDPDVIPSPADEPDGQLNPLLYAKLQFGWNSPQCRQMVALFHELGKMTGERSFGWTVEYVRGLPDVGFGIAVSIGGRDLKSIEDTLRDNNWEIPAEIKFDYPVYRKCAGSLCRVNKCVRAIVDANGFVELRDRGGNVVIHQNPALGAGEPRLSVLQLRQLHSLETIEFASAAEIYDADIIAGLLVDNLKRTIRINSTELPATAVSVNGELPAGDITLRDGSVVRLRGKDFAKLQKRFPGRFMWDGFRMSGGGGLKDQFDGAPIPIIAVGAS
jgi:hypothetical protein